MNLGFEAGLCPKFTMYGFFLLLFENKLVPGSHIEIADKVLIHLAHPLKLRVHTLQLLLGQFLAT